MRYAEEAVAAARAAGDEVLAAMAQFRLGLTCATTASRVGIAATEAAERRLRPILTTPCPILLWPGRA